MANEGQSEELDALCNRLKELMDLLPEMEEKNEKLEIARQANRIVSSSKLEECYFQLARQLHDDLMEKAAEFKAAKKTGDIEAQKKLEPEMYFLQTNEETNRGLAEQEKGHLKTALEESPFASLEEAQAASISWDDLRKLEKEVDEFRKEYGDKLARARELVDIVEPEE